MDYFLCSNLKIVIILGLVIGVGSVILPIVYHSRRKPPDSREDRGGEFRIVELQNGLFEVQQLRVKAHGWDLHKEWGRPKGDKMNTFNTLDEARAYRASLVADMLEQDGFNMKRVVE